MIYSCNKCNYKATRQYNLKKHKEFKHEDVRHSCNKCDYKATTVGNLKIHKQIKQNNKNNVCLELERERMTSHDFEQE